MAQHTPTPWSAKLASDKVDGQYDTGIVAQINGKPVVIGECFGRGSDGTCLDSLAHAEFIVRAANAHDDLVATLRKISTLRPAGPCSNKLVEQMERIALDALAKSEGKSDV